MLVSLPAKFQFLIFLSALLTVVIALASPTHAEISAWAHNEGGKMRILALPPEPDGTVRGALQIEPLNGWITYWREPGEAGIPPQISFPPESGLVLQALQFPIPKQFVDGDVRDLGYDHPVTLPFILKARNPGETALLKASAFIGLCRNICIPFQAEFQMNLSSAKLPLEENLILDEATRHLPEKPSATFHVQDTKLDPSAARLRLSLNLPNSEIEPEIYLVAPDGHVILDHTETRREGATHQLDFKLDGIKDKALLTKGNWSLLVKLGDRAMETSLAIN